MKSLMLISVCCLSFGSISSNCTQHYCTSYFVWQCTQQSQCNSFYVTSHGGGGVVGKKFIKGALCTGHNTFNQNVQEFGWLNYQPLCVKMSPHLSPDLRGRSMKEFRPKLVSRQVQLNRFTLGGKFNQLACSVTNLPLNIIQD